jgi:plastocyanin
MARSFRAAVLVTLLFTAACGSPGPAGRTGEAPPAPDSVSGAQTHHVNMDGDSPAEDNFVFGAYFPETIKARPGDTIVVENRSSHDIHTVTLGVRPDRSNSPRAETRTVQANPVVFGPCFTDREPSTDWEACPAPTASSEDPPSSFPRSPFSGKGYWNSGVVLPALLAGDEMPTAATIKLGDGIPSGPYALICLVHPFMNGRLEVVAKDADRLRPAAVAEAAERELEQTRSRAAALGKPTPAVRGATPVIAGWGDRVVAADVFAPSTISVEVGDTVTWTSQSPYMPHTVSFESPFAGPTDPNAFLPTGARSGSSYEGGIAHSGVLGPDPAFSSFSLRFAKPGTYPYVCILHPRMSGTVHVGVQQHLADKSSY